MHDGIRAYAMETTDPAELLERLNRLVCALTPPEQYATLFLGVLDTRNGRLRYCTAGHPAPAIVGKSGATYLISTRSPVMGAFPQAQFACLETVLRLDERLVLFTDGVTEARRGTQFLGEDGLLKLLVAMTKTPVDKFAKRLLDKVLKFADGHLRDDTVILSLERTKDTGAEK